MPSMLSSLVQGVRRYKKLASYQVRNNIVSQSYESAKFRGTSRAKAVAGAIGAGAATFLAPPVVIGAQAVKDYREKQDAAMRRTRLATMVECLKSHGISREGAAEMASLVILNQSTDHRISPKDFRMWKVVSCVIEPELERYTYRIVAHLETGRSQLDLA